MNLQIGLRGLNVFFLFFGWSDGEGCVSATKSDELRLWLEMLLVYERGLELLWKGWEMLIWLLKKLSLLDRGTTLEQIHKTTLR